MGNKRKTKQAQIQKDQQNQKIQVLKIKDKKNHQLQ
jgi:hypothetical protein